MKENRITQLLTCLIFLSIVACTDEVPIPTTPLEVAMEETDNTPTSTTEVADYKTGDSEYIFDQSKLHTFELTLEPTDLAKIDADPSAEEYVEGNLNFEGQTIGPVGIRYKGSIGAFVNCLTGTNWAKPSGSKTCTKLSMKVKMNWEDKETTFFDLKKLQFHAINLDESQMRDRLGYWLFRQMGVPAPRAVHARLVINGQFMGVYALIEQIDGRFTRHNYEDGKGNLYKEVWPLNSAGQPHKEKEYLDALKTNEEDAPSPEMIRTFAKEVAAASEEDLKTVIDKWMKKDEIIAYAVVDRTIRNDDGPFHWYCSWGECSPHNFYWYEEPTAQKMHLIPWDLDNAFENIKRNSNPVTPIQDEWGETQNDCKPFLSGFTSQRSAACDKLTRGWSLYEEEYEALKKQLIEGPLSSESINRQIDTWSTQIRKATEEAHSTHPDAISINTWERAMTELKSQLEFARNK